MSPSLSARRIIHIPKTVLSHTLFQDALALRTRLGVQRPPAARTETPDIEVSSSKAVQITQESNRHDLSMDCACWIRMMLSITSTHSTLPAFCANLIGGSNKHFSTFHNGTCVSANLFCVYVRSGSNCLHQPGEEGGHGGWGSGWGLCGSRQA